MAKHCSEARKVVRDLHKLREDIGKEIGEEIEFSLSLPGQTFDEPTIGL